MTVTRPVDDTDDSRRFGPATDSVEPTTAVGSGTDRACGSRSRTGPTLRSRCRDGATSEDASSSATCSRDYPSEYDPLRLTHETLPKPDGYYGASKMFGEHICRTHARRDGRRPHRSGRDPTGGTPPISGSAATSGRRMRTASSSASSTLRASLRRPRPGLLRRHGPGQ